MIWTVFDVEFDERAKCSFCKHQHIGTFGTYFWTTNESGDFCNCFSIVLQIRMPVSRCTINIATTNESICNLLFLFCVEIYENRFV